MAGTSSINSLVRAQHAYGDAAGAAHPHPPRAVGEYLKGDLPAPHFGKGVNSADMKPLASHEKKLIDDEVRWRIMSQSDQKIADKPLNKPYVDFLKDCGREVISHEDKNNLLMANAQGCLNNDKQFLYCCYQVLEKSKKCEGITSKIIMLIKSLCFYWDFRLLRANNEKIRVRDGALQQLKSVIAQRDIFMDDLLLSLDCIMSYARVKSTVYNLEKNKTARGAQLEKTLILYDSKLSCNLPQELSAPPVSMSSSVLPVYSLSPPVSSILTQIRPSDKAPRLQNFGATCFLNSCINFMMFSLWDTERGGKNSLELDDRYFKTPVDYFKAGVDLWRGERGAGGVNSDEIDCSLTDNLRIRMRDELRKLKNWYDAGRHDEDVERVLKNFLWTCHEIGELRRLQPDYEVVIPEVFTQVFCLTEEERWLGKRWEPGAIKQMDPEEFLIGMEAFLLPYVPDRRVVSVKECKILLDANDNPLHVRQASFQPGDIEKINAGITNDKPPLFNITSEGSHYNEEAEWTDEEIEEDHLDRVIFTRAQLAESRTGNIRAKTLYDAKLYIPSTISRLTVRLIPYTRQGRKLQGEVIDAYENSGQVLTLNAQTENGKETIMQFKPVAVICHAGISADCGHYITLTFPDDRTVLVHDDDNIWELSGNEGEDSQAIAIKYMRERSFIPYAAGYKKV